MKTRRGAFLLLVLSAVATLTTVLSHEVDVLAAAKVFTVDSTGDQDDSSPGNGVCRTSSGTCTLRAAIREANSNSGHDRIEFNISGSGPHTIRPGSAYRLITDPAGLTIDGYTQPGSSVNTLTNGSNAVIKIQLEGRGPTSIDGLDFRTSGGVVRGLAIYDFRIHVRFWGGNANGNEVIGNFLGTNAAGTFEHNRRWINSTGVQLEQGASSNRIGKPGNEHRNVISGTGDRGVATFDDNTDANLVQNNVIGLNPSGTARLRNWGHGVDVNYNSSYNIIGGTGAGERNVLSGNELSGVEISHMIGSDDARATQGNEVIGNLIGTNLTGSSAPNDFRNREHGVNLEGKGACPVYCSPDMRRNRVTDNVIVGSQAGVMIWKAAFDNVVEDNIIGVLADGSAAESSSQSIWGVLVEAGAFDNHIEGNRVSGVPNGVQIRPDNNYPASPNPPQFPTFGNTITQNSIFDIGPGFAIDLWPVGSINSGGNPTPGNVQHGVSLPSISSPDSDSVTVTTCAGCLVEIFLADYTCPTPNYGCSSHGQGRLFVTSQTANSSGVAEFVLRTQQSDPYVLAPGDEISATTTNTLGSTSEFSARVTVSQGSIPPPDGGGNRAPVVTSPGAQSSVVGDVVSLPIVATDPDGDPLTFSATGLPNGLSIGSSSGVISGTVTTAGTFDVTVTAFDGQASGQATFQWTVDDDAPPTGVVDVRVSSGSDDVEEIVANGQMYLNSSDLELPDDSSYVGLQTVGMRFNGVSVPAGATVTAAWLEFQTDETDTRATSLQFRAQAADNAPAFSSTSFNLSTRPTTAAMVPWSNVPNWNTVGQTHQTPDLSTVIQEVISRPGWSPGNSVVIAVTGSGRRVAESYNGSSSGAPLLHIAYSGA